MPNMIGTLITLGDIKALMVQLIKATQEDIGRLHEICSEAYIQSFADHWDGDGLSIYLEDQFNETRLVADISHNGTDYFFIESGGDDVGFLKIKYDARLENMAGESTCELEKIYVLPAHKGKGIGGTAIKELMSLCRDLGKQYMYLCVLDTNTPSIGFYKKLGFTYHSKTRLNEPHFKEKLKGMDRMIIRL